MTPSETSKKLRLLANALRTKDIDEYNSVSWSDGVDAAADLIDAQAAVVEKAKVMLQDMGAGTMCTPTSRNDLNRALASLPPNAMKEKHNA